MSITTVDGYVGAAKQILQLAKTTSRAAIATGWFSTFDVAGNPGAGVLAGTSTANGVVPTDAVAGYPAIDAFGGGATGYLGRVEFGSSVACRVRLFDRLFVSGAHAFNANQALTSQPSFSGRLPGTNYKGLQLWVEQVTAATGNQAVNVTYTNDAGVSSRTTGAIGIGAAPTLGRCWQLPLQAGDQGVQRVDNVAGTVASVGTFNVMVLRPLWSGRVRIANDGDVQDIFKTGMPQLFADSSLYMLIAPDSTATGIPELAIEIVNG